MPHFAHHSEENYLKSLYNLSNKDVKKVNNITLAKTLGLNPATVLEMVRKLTKKKLVELLPDKSLQLTEKGRKQALLTIRKHRLWEVFLVEKLKYKWHEVHDLAEQLEHIESASLTDRLEKFLDFPVYDPHGDPIPDKAGRIKTNVSQPLSLAETAKNYYIVNLAETKDSFLEYLEKYNLKPGVKVKLVEQNAYDRSCTILVNKKTVNLSEKVAQNLLVRQA